ncbi:hypothetical protein UP09_13875 [Bradyrhizobium sp. LTSP885]|uniref:DUF5625 family protein n=1 Tax=Bradyrhizobium sp. LTSP885 TaxID=1619232 RepID=UPI0005CA6063|nr:DUF5625 family protein [Bradyrhizobium sp. LTSP885]KJC44755.1 hypothetical protein UP09_13875 [Bradyrhizobium sp. LTSP885]
MGPIAYSLCHKEIIGLAMWITGFCAFAPLIPATEVSLRDPGLILSREFHAPVDTSYLLNLRFVFPSTESRIKDRLVGDGRTSDYCDSDIQYDAIPDHERSGLGLPIPFRVVVRSEPEGASVVERTFHSLCHAAHARNDKHRTIGRLDINRGSYRIEVTNLQPQIAFGDIKTEISLVSGDAN